jgi:DNA adenine methylase
MPSPSWAWAASSCAARRPRAEAINDISGDVVTLFRCLAEHYPYLIDMLRFRVASRAEFERLLAQPPERLTDLQRAVRFLYVQRLAFGGRVSGRTFGVDASSPARFDVGKLEPMLAEIHERLQSVVIERLPYAEFIRRYDRAGPCSTSTRPTGPASATTAPTSSPARTSPRSPASSPPSRASSWSPSTTPRRARNLRPLQPHPHHHDLHRWRSRPARELLISNFPPRKR